MSKTKSISSRLMAAILAVIMLMATLPLATVSADGVDKVIDFTKDGSLTIVKTGTTLDENQEYEKLGGAKYVLYKVAKINQTVTDNVAETTFEKLDSSLPDITGIDSINVAKFNLSALATLAEDTNSEIEKYDPYYEDGDNNDSTTATATVAGIGTAEFGTTNTSYTLEAGYVYLAVETAVPTGVTVANNFLVTVPSYEAATTDTNGNVLTEAHWNYDVVVYPKNETSIEKDAYIKIDDGTGNLVNQSITSASYGDVIYYDIKVSIPSDIKSYVNLDADPQELHYYYRYDIVDKIVSGLEYVGTPTVTVYDKDDAIKSVLVSDDGYTVTPATDAKSFTVSLIDTDKSDAFENLNPAEYVEGTHQNAYYNGYAEGDYIVITYEAKVVGSGADGAVTNKVEVYYEKDTTTPNGGGGETIYSYDYRAWKVGYTKTTDTDGNYKAVEGATFVLQNSKTDETGKLVANEYIALYCYSDGTYAWVPYASIDDIKAAEAGLTDGTEIRYQFTSDDDGLIEGIIGLAVGTYFLKEIEAPDGYTLLADSVEIKVSADTHEAANKAFDDNVTDMVAFLNTTEGSKYYSIKIVNKSSDDDGSGHSWTLPSTGDMGIGMFILIGGIIILAAVSLYIYNKKKNKHQS